MGAWRLTQLGGKAQMAWLITGGYGMLAQDMGSELQRRGIEYDAPDRDRLDITSPEAIAAFLDDMQPEVVVNCAAYTAVDAAEEDETAAFILNATAPQLLAQATAARNLPMIQVSTDYVFSGEATQPYGEDNPLNPLGAYGRTKAAGEWAVRANNPNSYIVRTAWLYGAGGPCFPKTMARVLHEKGAASVVDDQWGQPTWSADVARIIADLQVEGAPYGTYHATSTGETTWFGFTRAIAESIGVPPTQVAPVTTADFPRPAPRPAWSVLGHQHLIDAGITPIGPWLARWQEAASTVLAPSA